MNTVWIATAAEVDDDGGWCQIVTYDPEDVIRFLITYPDAHTAKWQLPDPDHSGRVPEMIGP